MELPLPRLYQLRLASHHRRERRHPQAEPADASDGRAFPDSAGTSGPPEGRHADGPHEPRVDDARGEEQARELRELHGERVGREGGGEGGCRRRFFQGRCIGGLCVFSLTSNVI